MAVARDGEWTALLCRSWNSTPRIRSASKRRGHPPPRQVPGSLAIDELANFGGVDVVRIKCHRTETLIEGAITCRWPSHVYEHANDVGTSDVEVDVSRHREQPRIVVIALTCTGTACPASSTATAAAGAERQSKALSLGIQFDQPLDRTQRHQHGGCLIELFNHVQRLAG